MGYSHRQFYEIRRNYQIYGAEGRLDRLPGAKGPHPNRVDEATEKAILEHSLEHPTHGCLRVAQELALKGVGLVYLQSVIDCHSRYARGRLYTTKLLGYGCAHAKRGRPALFREAGRWPNYDLERYRQGLRWASGPPLIGALPSARRHREHRTTKVRRPQSNGFVERLQRTLLDEHRRMQGLYGRTAKDEKRGGEEGKESGLSQGAHEGQYC